MSTFVFANNVSTQLAAAATSTQTSLTLASSSNFPTLSSGQIMPLTLKDAATGAIYETVYVTAISGVTLTVTRAQEGTGAQTWSIGDYAFCAPTAGTVLPVGGSTGNPLNAGTAVTSTEVPTLAQAQSGAIEAAVASGTANAIVLTRTVPVTALTDQMKVRFKAVATNTGAVTLNDSGLGAKNLYGQSNVALVGGEIVSGGEYEAIYNSTAGAYQLVAQSGGAMQVSPATAPSHAAQSAQIPEMIGGTPRMSASAALGATTATFTDDFVNVTSSLGLPGHKIANFSATLDLTKLNVINGMIGSAPTAGQFVGVYAVFNPLTGAYGVVGFPYAATAAIPSIATLVASYLAGFTETSLIGTVPAHQSNAGQFDHFNARGKYVRRTAVTMVNVSASVASLTSQSTGIAIPASAIKMKGNMFATSTSTSSSSNVLQLASDGTGLDANIAANGTTTIQEPYELLMQTANTFFYSNSASVGTPQSQVTCTGYEWA
ncbi:hypothetical protein [Robbsia andropogonis]|uniref:hypothetical protein n=1 Tax=Robbsia andropogonis TaxID=28092 RepID=UPI002A69DF8B|nr:hypothetical protein [Robbsia andropogonis]